MFSRIMLQMVDIYRYIIIKAEKKLFAIGFFLALRLVSASTSLLICSVDFPFSPIFPFTGVVVWSFGFLRTGWLANRFLKESRCCNKDDMRFLKRK